MIIYMKSFHPPPPPDTPESPPTPVPNLILDTKEMGRWVGLKRGRKELQIHNTSEASKCVVLGFKKLAPEARGQDRRGAVARALFSGAREMCAPATELQKFVLRVGRIWRLFFPGIRGS